VNHQRLLLDHLDLIDQIVRMTGRKRHLSGVELEDFASFVKFRLVEDNYAILRKFQKRSTLHTYLIAVIERMALDFCVERWGRWRPSAKAERLGAVAVTLERLVTRDGHTLEEAMEIVRTNHAAPQTYAELRAMWDQLPARSKAIEVGEDAAEEVPSPDTSDVGVENEARARQIARLDRALLSAFEALPAQDRVMVALRYDHGLSAMEIAKAMQSSVPTVHRRLDRSLKALRAALSSAGIEPAEILNLIGHSTVVLSPLLRAEVERFLRHVRLSK
jgi:RNA polymerase sigma factor for flagellar operon FliA